MTHSVIKIAVLLFGLINLYWLYRTLGSPFSALTLIHAVSTGGTFGALAVTHGADMGRARHAAPLTKADVERMLRADLADRAEYERKRQT